MIFYYDRPSEGHLQKDSFLERPSNIGIEYSVIGEVVEETFYPGFCCNYHSGGRVL